MWMCDDEFLDRNGMADRLKVEPKTISAWVRRRRVPPPTRIGRLARWYWPDVVNFLSPASTARFARDERPIPLAE